MSDKLKASS